MAVGFSLASVNAFGRGVCLARMRVGSGELPGSASGLLNGEGSLLDCDRVAVGSTTCVVPRLNGFGFAPSTVGGEHGKGPVCGCRRCLEDARLVTSHSHNHDCVGGAEAGALQISG